MRCLYCGNELALLRKLTGYGEFCSEAHRQKYQEQYNRLALTRLLQAQEAEPERPPLSSPLRATMRNGGTLGAGKARKEIDAPSQAEPIRPRPRPTATQPPPPPRSTVASTNPVPPPAGFLKVDRAPVNVKPQMRGGQPDLVMTPSSFREGAVAEVLRPVPPIWAVDKKPPLPEPPVRLATPAAPAGPVVALVRPSTPLELGLAEVAVNPATSGGPESYGWPPATYLQTLAGAIELLAPPKTEPEPVVPPAPPPPAPGDQASRSKRSDVVINWAALGIEDEPAAPPPSAAPVPPIAPEPPHVAPEPEPEPPPAPPPAPVPVLCRATADIDLPVATVGVVPVDTGEFLAPVFDITTPSLAGLPLRPKFAFGPSPAEAHETIAEPVAAPPPPAPVAAPLPVAAPPKPPAPAPEPPPAKPVEPPVVEPWRKRQPTTETAKPAEKPAPPPETPKPEPAKPEPVKAETPKAETPKTEVPKAAPPKPQPPKPEAPKAAPAEAPKAAKPAGQKASSRPQSRLGGPSLDRGRRRMSDDSDLDSLRAEMERQSGGTVARSRPTMRRIAVAAAIVALVALVGYALWHEAVTAKAGSSIKSVQKGAPAQLEVSTESLIEGEGGWKADLAGEASNEMLGRSVYIYDRSRTMTDYRYEFEGVVKKKGLGWLFRAQNPRNYYSMRLEVLRTGPEMDAVLIRTAVINGEETQKTTIPLPGPVREGTKFQIRTDVFGSTFRTYIQGNLVDTWVDDRLKAGAVGLWKNQDEDCDIRLIQLHGLKAVAN